MHLMRIIHFNHKQKNPIIAIQIAVSSYTKMEKLASSTQKFLAAILKHYNNDLPFSLKGQIITFRSYLQSYKEETQFCLQTYVDRLQVQLLKKKQFKADQLEREKHTVNSCRFLDYETRIPSIDLSVRENMQNNDENFNSANLCKIGYLGKTHSDNQGLGASLGHQKDKKSAEGLSASSSTHIKSLKIILKPKNNFNFVNKPIPAKKSHTNHSESELSSHNKFFENVQLPKPLKRVKCRAKLSFENEAVLEVMKLNVKQLLASYSNCEFSIKIDEEETGEQYQ